MPLILIVQLKITSNLHFVLQRHFCTQGKIYTTSVGAWLAINSYADYGHHAVCALCSTEPYFLTQESVWCNNDSISESESESVINDHE